MECILGRGAAQYERNPSHGTVTPRDLPFRIPDTQLLAQTNGFVLHVGKEDLILVCELSVLIADNPRF